MIVVMNRITVAEGREEEFEQTFLTRDRAVDKMTGFIDLQVLRPSEGRTYVVMTRWNSREAFDTWTSSEVFLSAHRKPSAGFAKSSSVLEIYEVLTS
ncbi:MAG TPA: antibiotic biosynthesis monooxygenase [Pyrinomonadaceae bacterium]|jgi:heme-degrading monooxygenase HmoA